jgi:co-chaperonin GroES (HSP10)
MRATGNRCFILPNWDSEDKAGKLFLPKVRHRDLPKTGKVISIPPGASAEFKEGDTVIYDYHKSQLVNVPGEPLTMAMVKITDVMAVII